MICRLYLNQPLYCTTSLSLPDEQNHYLRSVMRLSPGDPVLLFNGEGGEFHATVEVLSKHDSSVYIESFADVTREMPLQIHIVQAACRSEKIESILQKATELGAASFHIIKSERSALKLDGTKLEKRLQRWQKIILEAAEQSGRTILPKLYWHNKLSSTPHAGLCFTLHPDTDISWSQQRDAILASKEVTLAIGPEGGWSRRDIDSLTQNGFTNLSFGPRVMRTETAAPALLAAIQSFLE